jgi:4-carboxymuconolactone decarboxylase
MPRINYPDPSTLPKELQNYLQRGNNLNILRMLSHASPAVFDGFNRLSQGLMVRSPLDPSLRELAILRVSYLSKAAYEMYHHEAIGRAIGLSEEQLHAIQRGAADAVLSPAQQAVMAFTDDMVINVRASDANLANVRAFLSDSDLVDLIMVIGCYMMVARLLETTGVEIDSLPLTLQTLANGKADMPSAR